jgi:hypothetical protein
MPPRPHPLVVSHQSAAALWGLELLRPPELCHVTVPRRSSKRVLPDTVVHRADLGTRDVVQRDGMRVTTVERTAVDLARLLPLPEGVALMDSALRLGVPLGRLQQRSAAARGPGSRALGRAVALADPRSESFLESSCRAILAAAGLAPERTQLWVHGPGGRRLARVDFAWPSYRVVVELDGFAFHSGRERYRSDRRRINALGLAGWLVLRFSWEDVVGNPHAVVSAVRRALYGEVAA